MKHATNKCCRRLLQRFYQSSRLPVLQIRVSEEISKKDVCTKRNRKMNRAKNTKSPPLLTHMQIQPWTMKKKRTTTREKTEKNSSWEARRREGSGAQNLCAARRRRNSLSLLCFVGQKGSSGRTAGSSGGRRGEDGIAAEPENPKNSAEKNFPKRRVET